MLHPTMQVTREIVISGRAFPAEVENDLVQAGFSITRIPGDLTEPEVVAALADAWGYVLGGAERVGPQAWDSLPNLRCVCVLGTGVEPFLMLPASPSQIAFTYTPHANADAVVEFTLGLAVALVRGLPSQLRAVEQGRWPKETAPSLVGASVGVIGMGHIGKKVARILNTAFDADVCYWNRGDRPELASLPYRRCQTVAEVMSHSSLVTLHCTYVSGDNDGMIGLPELQALGPRGYLVNPARAQLIDLAALRVAIENDLIAGVALDGFYEEPAPLPADDPHGLLPLLRSDRLIVTPHSAYLTEQATRSMAELAVRNLLAVADGQPAPYPVPR